MAANRRCSGGRSGRTSMKTLNTNTGSAAIAPPLTERWMVAPSISVGAVNTGSPPWGERRSPPGTRSHRKISSWKYHEALAPIPNVRKTPRRYRLTRRPKRWSAPLSGALTLRRCPSYYYGEGLRSSLHHPEARPCWPPRCPPLPIRSCDCTPIIL